MLIILITINQIIPEQMMPGDPYNWLLVKTLFFNQAFVWHEENLPGRVSWVVPLCCQWLASSLGVGMLCALKVGEILQRRLVLGSKLSSVLQQSILGLSTMIFRSTSMNILWSSAFLCLVQVSMEEGQGDPSPPWQLLGWVAGLASWANLSSHIFLSSWVCLKRSLERGRSWYLHMAQLIKRCFRHGANQALEPSVLQMLLCCDYSGALSLTSCELWSSPTTAIVTREESVTQHK